MNCQTFFFLQLRIVNLYVLDINGAGLVTSTLGVVRYIKNNWKWSIFTGTQAHCQFTTEWKHNFEKMHCIFLVIRIIITIIDILSHTEIQHKLESQLIWTRRQEKYHGLFHYLEYVVQKNAYLPWRSRVILHAKRQ